MIFTQQVIHLEWLILFQIKCQPDVTYKSVVYKKAFDVIFKSFKNEEFILPHKFISVFILYLIGVTLSEKP